MEGVEVDRVFSGLSSGEVVFWINCDVQVITFISKEW